MSSYFEHTVKSWTQIDFRVKSWKRLITSGTHSTKVDSAIILGIILQKGRSRGKKKTKNIANVDVERKRNNTHRGKQKIYDEFVNGYKVWLWYCYCSRGTWKDYCYNTLRMDLTKRYCVLRWRFMRVFILSKLS